MITGFLVFTFNFYLSISLLHVLDIFFLVANHFLKNFISGIQIVYW